MSERNFKIGFLTKLVSITVVVAVCFVPDSFGRNGVKLYSVVNNAAWTSASTWSLTANGPAAGLVPQNNDTLIINCTVLQNLDFAFSGNGILEVTNTGLLRGDNQNLDFTGNSNLNCYGEVRINNLNINGNSKLLLRSNGKILVKNSFISNSLSEHIVSGKLSVTGNLSIGTAVNITGNGIIESAHYDGPGSILSIKPASFIPDGSLISENNWIGAQDNNWNEPLNWAGRKVPGNNSNIAVVSSKNNPEIKGLVYSSNLFVNSGSSITLYPNAIFEINGNLSVIGSGKFLLKNTITEKSSLVINGEVSGKIQSEYQVLKGQKNLISSPVETALSQTFLNMYLRTYDEAASQWGQYIVPTNDPLKVMQGYELYSLTDDTRVFEGTPVQGQKSLVISNSGNGLNLTGNPFTCFIDWENTNNGWQSSSIGSAIYYPDPSGSGNFSVYLPGGDDAVSLNNGSRYIAPMQGFFVKAAKQGSLTVNTNSRVNNIIKSKLVLKNNSIKFKLNDSDGTKDEVLFRVIENATSGFDEKLDAIKIPGNTDSPSLSLESDDDVKYAVNTLPSINSSVNIPLNIECTKAGQFSISAIGALAFEYRYPVILEDKELNAFTDLRADSVYSFYHTPDMKSNRFEIHFTTPQAVNEQETPDPTEVALTPGEVVISGSNNDFYTAFLYSTEGKLISSSKGTLSEGISLSTSTSAPGICILQLSNGKQTITKKVFTR